MTNYNQTLKTNNSSLEEIITQLNNMPDAGTGTELPTLTNEGSASDLLFGKQLIDGDGNVVTGTIPTQAAKTITPSTSSQTAVASGRYTTGAITVAPIPSNYEDVTTEATEYTLLNDELEEVINSLPAAGGGESDGASVEICTVTVVSNGVGSNSFSGLYYVKADDGEPTSYYGFYLKNDSSVIPYVVKGSLIVFSESTGVANVTNDGGTVLRTHANGTICFISTTAPDNVTITLNSAT